MVSEDAETGKRQVENKSMKKLLLSLLVFTLLLFMLLIGNAEARSGCCSHHGGVCGCRCCDGTPLSATCAPYYPQCGAKPTPQPKYESPTPKDALPTPEYKSPAPSEEGLLSPEKYTAEVPKGDEGNSSFWWWILGIGFASFLFYKIGKRKVK